MELIKPTLPDISDMFTETFAFLKDTWKIFAPVILVMSAPSIISALLSLAGVDLPNGLMVLLSIASIATSIWGGTALFYILKEIIEGRRDLPVVEVYKQSIPYILPLIGTQLIIGLLGSAALILATIYGLATQQWVVMGFLVFLALIPAIVFMVLGFAASYVVFFENIKYFAAFKRSKELVMRQVVGVVVRLFVLLVAIILLHILLSIIPIVGVLVAPFIIVPVTTYYLYILYRSLRDETSLSAPVHTTE